MISLLRKAQKSAPVSTEDGLSRVLHASYQKILTLCHEPMASDSSIFVLQISTERLFIDSKQHKKKLKV